MRWRDRSWDWKRRFALLPLRAGGEWVWLEWYWARFAGDCTEVSYGQEVLTEGRTSFNGWSRPPATSDAPVASEGEG